VTHTWPLGHGAFAQVEHLTLFTPRKVQGASSASVELQTLYFIFFRDQQQKDKGDKP
jgi:hypothetical protein